MATSVKSLLSVLSNVPAKFLRLDALASALNLPPTADSYYDLLSEVRDIEKRGGDLVDMGADWIPVVVAWKGSSNHGIGFDKSEMPAAPRKHRAGTDTSKAPPKMYFPAVMLVSAEAFTAMASADLRADSAETAFLSMVAAMPDSFKARFGEVHGVKLDSNNHEQVLVTVTFRL